MKRTKYIVAAVAATLVAVVAVPALTSHSSDPARGTQSDSHVGTSQYPAPKKANSIPTNMYHTPAAVIENLSTIPALRVEDRCQWAGPRGNNPPSRQDDGVGVQKFSDMPSIASTGTLKCAIARAKAAGYAVTGNSVKCNEPVVELLDEGNDTLWSFAPFCMQVGQTDKPTCKITLIPTDYQGNFLWQSEPDLSRLQDILAQSIVDEDPNVYGGCNR